MGEPEGQRTARRGAWRFIAVIGIVSLFADMVYEGARSIVGAYFFELGASALVVGVIGGGAEFLGYAVRWFAGRGADASGRHWLFMYTGYALNLVVVPFLALTGSVGAAAGLVAGERIGKGVRKPSRDALLARAGERVGQGAGFGVHEFLDQLGGVAGPLIVAALVVAAGYRAGFAILAIPVVLALGVLAFARRFEVERAHTLRFSGKFPRPFWLWVVFAALATAGFAHFSLVAFALAAIGFTPVLIPVLFAVAMAAEGIAGLVFGRLSDRTGAWLLAGFPVCGLFGTALLFVAPGWLRWLGAVVWGVGLGFQEAVVRARIARVVAEGRRAEAFGILDTAMGAAWFLGSVLLGALFEWSPAALAAGAVLIECAALAWLLLQWSRLRGPARRQ